MNPETKKNETTELIANAFHSFENQMNGEKDSFFHKLRVKAFTKFNELGFPDIKHEEYKYTHIINKVPKNLHFNISPSTEADSKTLNSLLPVNSKAAKIVMFNGKLSESLSDYNKLKEGINVMTIHEAIQNTPEIITDLLTEELNHARDAFVPLNTALSLNGLFIEIKEGADINVPLYIIHYSDSSEDGLFINSRNIVIGKKGSRFSFAELFIGKNEQFTFENHCTSITLEENSSLSYTKIQLIGNQSVHIGTTLVQQLQNSMFKSDTVTVSGGMVRNNLNVSLLEEKCETHLNGLFFPTGKDHIDNHTVVDHRVPNCFSNELYKGIIDGQGKGVFNGKIYVQPQAQKTNAYQSNKNVLLSDTASVNTKPQLEIWADDVKCTHGTSTGKLDDEQLFYLRSRGIDEKTARSLLIYAFAKDVSDKIELEEIREIVDHILQDRLGQNFNN